MRTAKRQPAPLLHVMDDDEIEEFWHRQLARKELEESNPLGLWDWFAAAMIAGIALCAVFAVYEVWFA